MARCCYVLLTATYYSGPDRSNSAVVFNQGTHYHHHLLKALFINRLQQQQHSFDTIIKLQNGE